MPDSGGPALVQVIKPNKGIVYPENYLKAAGELLFLLFGVVWGITWIWHPEVIADNPIKDVMGYNNLCVGFDMPPATYVGLLIAFPIVYLCFRYSWTDLERSVLMRSELSDTQYRFSVATNVLYMVSICGFGLAFVVSPYVSVTAHFLAFLQFIVVRFLVVWANVYESPSPSRATMRFLWVYGGISLVLPAIAVANLLHYSGAPSGSAPSPLVPYQISMVLDYAWFACLALTTTFLPRGNPLRFNASVSPEPLAPRAQTTGRFRHGALRERS